MSAKRRKYEFNVIDYLWYMGKDSERMSQFPTPNKAVACSIVILLHSSHEFLSSVSLRN